MMSCKVLFSICTKAVFGKLQLLFAVIAIDDLRRLDIQDRPRNLT